MDKKETFEQFLTTQTSQIVFIDFLINLLIAALLSYILSKIYSKLATTLSNREHFAHNFVTITLTTMFIITVVKSSLALSLGLVGALSIVRFRTAIKEPEELSYLFLCISIGLGLGAGQRLISIFAFVVIVTFILLKKKFHRFKANQNLYLTVSSRDAKELNLNDIVTVIKNYCSSVDIKRFDENKETLEASFLVEVDDFKNLQNIRNDLLKINPSVAISFIDHSREV